MENQIKEKLNDLLRELPFTKEYQVVYLFVETRKLLERIGQLDKYTYIRFFCDWVLHTDKKYHLDVIRDDFDKIAADMESQAKKSIVQLILGADKHPFAELAAFSKLRVEIEKFFSESEITKSLVTDDNSWFSLRNLLFRILADQPIDFGDRPVRGIKSIRFNEVRKELYGCILMIEFIENGKLIEKKYVFADDKPNFRI